MSAADEQTWSLLSHVGPLLISFVSIPGFVFPLAVLFIKGKKSDRVRGQAIESLNFQLNVLIISIVLVVAALVGGVFSILNNPGQQIPATIAVLIGAAIFLGIASIALPIVAAVRIAGNKEFRYPLIIRMVK
jgi:hypothetical protein